MTDAEILAEIRNRGFPLDPDLQDDEVTAAIGMVKRDLKYTYPITTYGTFNLHDGQQVYDLFNATPDTTTSQGIFPGGITVVELVWSPSGTGTGLSVFGIAPFLQGMTILPGDITIYSFNSPSDWWIWDNNWAQFVHRFGSQFFEPVENRPGSPIRIFPVPSGEQTAFCRYKKYRDPDTFQTSAEDESSFFTLVEGNCAITVARKLKAVAGTTLGSIKNDGKSSLYWQMEGERLLKEGWEVFNNHYYEITSSVGRS